MDAIKIKPKKAFNRHRKYQINAEIHSAIIYLCEHNLLFFLLFTRNFKEIQTKFSPRPVDKMRLLSAQFKRSYAKKMYRKKRRGKISDLMNKGSQLSCITPPIHHSPASMLQYIDTQRLFSPQLQLKKDHQSVVFDYKEKGHSLSGSSESCTTLIKNS